MAEWIKKAGIRAIKTFAQTMLSFITIGLTIGEIDWLHVLSVSAVALLYSILTSIVGGMPEMKTPNVVGDISVNPETADAIIQFNPDNGANLKLGSKVAFNVVESTFDDTGIAEEGDES